MTRRKLIVRLVLLVLAALVAACILLSKYGLEVTRLKLGFEELPAGFDGFRIVQLSDLHGSRFGENNARLLEAVAAEGPDIIALTGDFLDEGETERELPELEALVRELSAIAPVYFVSGNHDWASGEAYTLFETLEAAGAVCLRNEHLRLERGGDSIVLAGVDDPNGPAEMAEPDEFVASLRQEAPDSFVLLLAHRLLAGAADQRSVDNEIFQKGFPYPFVQLKYPQKQLVPVAFRMLQNLAEGFPLGLVQVACVKLVRPVQQLGKILFRIALDKRQRLPGGKGLNGFDHGFVFQWDSLLSVQIRKERSLPSRLSTARPGSPRSGRYPGCRCSG